MTFALPPFSYHFRRLCFGFFLSLLTIAPASPAPAGNDSLTPKVFLIEADQLQAIQKRVIAKDPNLVTAAEKVRKEGDEALEQELLSVMQKQTDPPSGNRHDYMSMAPYFWPNPDTPDHLPYIRRDGERNPEIYSISDRMNLSTLADSLERLGYAYYLFGDERYAAKAAALLRCWFLDPATRMNPNLQYAQAIRGLNTGRGIGLIESREFAIVVDSVGLLTGSTSWKESDQKELEQWFTQYLQWMLESEPGKQEAQEKNNHGTFYDFQVADFALFLGKTETAKQVLEKVGPRRIAVQIEPDGKQPLELVRTKAWGYSNGNLRGLVMLARLGEHAGVDLWHYQTEDGRCIQKAIDYLIPFSIGGQKWNYAQLGEWTPDLLIPILHHSASRYPEKHYREQIANSAFATTLTEIELLHWRMPHRDLLKD